MKQRVKLTESQLYKLIQETVKDAIMKDAKEKGYLYGYKKGVNESYNQYGVWDLIDELKEVMSAEDILNRIIARISPIEAKRMLEDILSIEGPEYDEEE